VRDFHSLSQKEILALAISLEEEDERIYADFAESMRENFPGTASMFDQMGEEKSSIAGGSSRSTSRGSASTFLWCAGRTCADSCNASRSG